MKLTLETLHLYCHSEGDCLLWKLGINGAGYPQAMLDGKPGQMVRRYVFCNLMQKRAGDRQVIRSLCGNKLCVSPACLRRATKGDVLRIAYASGSRNTRTEYMSRLEAAKKQGMVKLDWDKVEKIRALPEEVSDQQAAAMFGVYRSTINKIRAGRSWRVQKLCTDVFSWRPA